MDAYSKIPDAARGSVKLPRPIPPELVRQVADRVYALLLADLKVEKERSPRQKGKPNVRQ